MLLDDAVRATLKRRLTFAMPMPTTVLEWVLFVERMPSSALHAVRLLGNPGVPGFGAGPEPLSSRALSLEPRALSLPISLEPPRLKPEARSLSPPNDIRPLIAPFAAGTIAGYAGVGSASNHIRYRAEKQGQRAGCGA